MFKNCKKQIIIALKLLGLFSILTGLIYPAVVTLFAQLLFPWQANGSLIELSGEKIGSVLIGQSFTDPKYFWGRPSATTPFPYNGINSTGSNLGPSNPDFLASIKDRSVLLRKLDPTNTKLIPVDLVTASGSGLDPEISPLSAFYQVSRIVKARNMLEADLTKLIQTFTTARTFGILGEPRVNVLQINMALDNLKRNNDRTTSKP